MITDRETFVAAARTLIQQREHASPDAVAAAVGVSRSTYFRVVGSHLAVLREAGQDEGPGTETRLFDAAGELLTEFGISRFDMDEVAKRAGVSRATLYRYFSSKAELMARLAQTRSPLRGLGQLLTQMASQRASEVLPALLVAAAPRLMSSRGLLRAILAEAAVDGPDGSAAREVMRDAYGVLATYLEGQMDAGHLRKTDALAAAQALIGPVLLFAVVRPDFWSGGQTEHLTSEDMLLELAGIWLRGMEPG